jgi:hypothetical protein
MVHFTRAGRGGAGTEWNCKGSPRLQSRWPWWRWLAANQHSWLRWWLSRQKTLHHRVPRRRNWHNAFTNNRQASMLKSMAVPIMVIIALCHLRYKMPNR